MRKLLLAAFTVAILSGCATAPSYYVPLMDTPGKDPAKMASDITDCNAYADTQMSGAGGAAGGAIIGALFGVALLAAGGGRHGYGNEIAGLGALSGGAAGYVAAETNQRAIVSRCLAGRGYSVLQ
jgi:outer membrane lipoprotein SlyB